MKIHRAKLQQILREELSGLREADTVDMYQSKRRAKREKERQNLEDFFGSKSGLDTPDTKAMTPVPSRAKPRPYRDPDARWKDYLRQQRAADAARGGTQAMPSPEQRRRDKERPEARKFFGGDDPLVTKVGAPSGTDPDKTVAVSRSVQPGDMSDVPPDEREAAAAKLATHRQLDDAKRVSITDFTDDAKEKILEMYEKKADISIDPTPLGSGEFGIVYKGDNPEYGPVAVKFTLSGQEVNAYKNIKKLKEGLEDRDPEAGTVLPTILDIATMASPSMLYVWDLPGNRMRAAPKGDPDATKYKVFVIQMELLDKLDPNLRADIFGPSPLDEYPPEVQQRFVSDYLTIENIYSSLEHLLGDMRWEKVLDDIQEDPGPVNEGPRGSLPIKDKRAFPPFREIEKILPRLRQTYLEAPAENHFFALKDIHKILATQITKIFEKYMTDDTLLGQLEGSAGYMLPAQMAANAKLPQYDPETIEKMPGLRSNIMPPSELQTRVAKSFYKRLKKLEEWDAQYGDVHPNNLMMRDNGDLVVADVGLFLFGASGSRGYAGTIAERLKILAGLL